MRETAREFLHGELTASAQIMAAGLVLGLVALGCLITGMRGRSRWRTGMAISLLVFAALALIGGISYRGTVQGLLETVPRGMAVQPAATTTAELERMTTGVDRLEMLVRFVWPSLIAGGTLLAFTLRTRTRALAGAAMGIALGSVLTLSIDVLGIHRSTPYEDELRSHHLSAQATP